MDLFLIYAGTDDTEASDDACAACPHIRLAWYIVEVNPGSVFRFHDALRTENLTVSVLIFQRFQCCSDLFLCELLRGLHTDAVENLVCMVMAMMIVVVIMAAATAAVVVVVMVIMVVIMMMVMVMVMVVVMVMVMVMAAAAVVVMLMLMVVVVVIMMMLMFFFQMVQCFLDGIFLFHGIQNLLAAQFLPVGGDDRCVRIMLPQHLHSLFQFFFIHTCRVTEDNGAGVFNLIIKELTEILHVNLRLLGIDHRGESIELDMIQVKIFHCFDDV